MAKEAREHEPLLEGTKSMGKEDAGKAVPAARAEESARGAKEMAPEVTEAMPARRKGWRKMLEEEKQKEAMVAGEREEGMR